MFELHARFHLEIHARSAAVLGPMPRMPRPALQVKFPSAQAGMAGARPHGRIQHAQLALVSSPRPSLLLAGALQSAKTMVPGRKFYLNYNQN